MALLVHLLRGRRGGGVSHSDAANVDEFLLRGGERLGNVFHLVDELPAGAAQHLGEREATDRETTTRAMTAPALLRHARRLLAPDGGVRAPAPDAWRWLARRSHMHLTRYPTKGQTARKD